MKIIIAPDSFKDSLSSTEVCDAIEKGIKRILADAILTKIPLADGGEGTAEIIGTTLKAEKIECDSEDALGKKIKAYYYKKNDLSILDMAACSGLQGLKQSERDPMNTSSYGTGLMIRHAIDNGAKKIILGLGGSATCDAGLGMAAALGYRFYANGKEIEKPGGADLKQINQVEKSGGISLSGIDIQIACDVTNPLYGPNGSAFIYARQKGANDQQILGLDEGLKNIGRLCDNEFEIEASNYPGAGAAGGMGAGALWFLRAKLKPGAKLILDLLNFNEELDDTHLVITGEGSIDQQTFSGKLVKELVMRCKEKNVPGIAICGTLKLKAEEIDALGLSYCESIFDEAMELESALSSAEILIENKSAHLALLIKSMLKSIE